MQTETADQAAVRGQPGWEGAHLIEEVAFMMAGVSSGGLAGVPAWNAKMKGVVDPSGGLGPARIRTACRGVSATGAIAGNRRAKTAVCRKSAPGPHDRGTSSERWAP